jgi:hypothetical protein
MARYMEEKNQPERKNEGRMKEAKKGLKIGKDDIITPK